MPTATLTEPHGWYGPPTSRRFHYIDAADAKSLCGKWLVPAWSADLIDYAVGPANGDCADCSRRLAALRAEGGES